MPTLGLPWNGFYVSLKKITPMILVGNAVLSDDIKENLVATFGEDILNQPKTSNILLLTIISLGLSAIIFFWVFARRK